MCGWFSDDKVIKVKITPIGIEEEREKEMQKSMLLVFNNYVVMMESEMQCGGINGDPNIAIDGLCNKL